jgi:hypothetical protein
MKPKKLLFLLLPLIIAGGCKKDKNEKGPLDGSYSGTVIITSASTPNEPGKTYVFNVGFSMHTGNFNSPESTTNTALGRGTYSVNGQTVIFTNTAHIPVQIKIFPYVTMLNGSYSYTVRGDSVFFNLPAVVGPTAGDASTTEYKLKRN